MSKFVFFHSGPFSQWTKSPFVYDGIVFNTAEQWMMWNKAIFFKDYDIAEQILVTKNPFQQKKLGRQVSNFVDREWMTVAYDYVVQGNRLKFEQNPNLLAELRKTKGKVIVEASPHDRRWGIGMKTGDPGIENPANWKGQNLLGQAITEVRIEIFGD